MSNPSKPSVKFIRRSPGTIKETNEELIDAPEKLNEDCYGNWICVMENVSGLDDLLSPEAYSEYLTTLE